MTESALFVCYDAGINEQIDDMLKRVALTKIECLHFSRSYTVTMKATDVVHSGMNLILTRCSCRHHLRRVCTFAGSGSLSLIGAVSFHKIFLYRASLI